MKNFIRLTFKITVILAVDLIVQVINEEILQLSSVLPPHLVVLSGMLIVVVLFYFLMTYLSALTHWVLRHTVELAKATAWPRVGISLMILLILCVEFLAFYRIWFGKWLTFSDLAAITGLS